ncbi:MAG: isocitrate/isopropylmalate dehydrogenase family protein [Rhodospirillaceae bacterium]|nr:isocitrate/isopropylmalate dehydrogenase family protein [Rhodospirillaceae bacterium]MBT7485881.1 isocitrate/isopropylmalate dehydrogenase family protein [Rhodospirillales bacterium]
MTLKIVTMPGDGIGPEISQATGVVLDAAMERFSLDIELQPDHMGFALLEQEGETFSDRVLEKIRAADGFIMGPNDTINYPPKEEGGRNPTAETRKSLDLFANIRPAVTVPGQGYTRKPMDLVFFRENTEGFYADRSMALGSGEFKPTEDLALSVRKITRQASERIARAAFEAAKSRRKKVTAVAKGNVLKISDGLFLEAVQTVAEDYPDIELEIVIVDAMAALLVRSPETFDVIVTTNMYGDILSDEASELAGSLGLAPSINAGDNIAMAQAQHGSAPDIAGQDKANPTSLILSMAMLLEWLGRRHNDELLTKAAQAVEEAVHDCLNDPATRTGDLGGPLGTRAFGQAVADKVKG